MDATSGPGDPIARCGRQRSSDEPDLDPLLLTHDGLKSVSRTYVDTGHILIDYLQAVRHDRSTLSHMS
jgi:hypothetical protein